MSLAEGKKNKVQSSAKLFITKLDVMYRIKKEKLNATS